MPVDKSRKSPKGERGSARARLAELEAALAQSDEARIRAEDGREKSERRFRYILDLSPDAIYVHVDDDLLYVNDAAVRLFGASTPGELVGRKASSLTELSDRARLAEARRQIKARSRTDTLMDIRMRRLDGSVMETESFGLEIEWEGRRANLVTIRDVSDRKRAEARMRESEAQYRLVTDNVPAAIIAVDTDLSVRFANRTLCEWYTRPASEIVGRKITEFVPTEVLAVFSPAIEAVLAGKTTRMEHKVTYPDGRERWVDFLRVPDFGEDGTVQGYVTLSVDITERKRFEAALIAEKDRAEVANRAKSEFLAAMSHELRTPLNAIIGFAELMKMEAMGPIANDVYRQYSRDIALSGSHLLSLINDILDLAKVEAGKIELREEAVSLAELFEATGRMVRERAVGAKLQLEIDDGQALPPIQGDRRKLMQILVNLLSNAIKFTPEGGRVALTGRRDESGDFLLAIADTGIGMAPEELTKAMMPFGQIDSSLSRKYAGTGLGLPLAGKLAELHGGAIAIDSTPGKGTTVTVRLPARRVRKRAA